MIRRAVGVLLLLLLVTVVSLAAWSWSRTRYTPPQPVALNTPAGTAAAPTAAVPGTDAAVETDAATSGEVDAATGADDQVAEAPALADSTSSEPPTGDDAVAPGARDNTESGAEASRSPRERAARGGGGAPPPERVTPLADPTRPPILGRLMELRGGEPGRWNATFDIELTNTDDEPRQVYVIVYARNDVLKPPRRAAWPASSKIFDFSQPTGALSSRRMRQTWVLREKPAKGYHTTLRPGEVRTIKAAIPLRRESQHTAWKGRTLEPVGFLEYLLWIFDEDGKVLLNTRYEQLAKRLDR